MSDILWTVLHSYLHGDITEDAAVSALADMYERDGWVFYYDPPQSTAIQPALATLYARYIEVIESRRLGRRTDSTDSPAG